MRGSGGMTQNISHAVMAQRHEPHDSLDHFPTPPWAVRALCEHVIGPVSEQWTAWEPACAEGYMARALDEYFRLVFASDVHPYGFGFVADFLLPFPEDPDADWIITNPPFKLAEDFIATGLRRANVGVAVLVRTTFLESIGRFERFFRDRPPTFVAQFVERVPMVKGRVDPKASTATGYAWLVWDKRVEGRRSEMVWIPPCRQALERPEDYERVAA